MMTMMTALLLSFSATSLVGKEMFLTWIILLFFCIGGVYSLFPIATVRHVFCAFLLSMVAPMYNCFYRAFGSKYFASNYGLVFSSQVERANNFFICSTRIFCRLLGLS